MPDQINDQTEGNISKIRKSLVEIAAIITALGVIVTFILTIRPEKPGSEADYFQIIVVILNLIVLIAFCLTTKRTHKLEFKKEKNDKDKLVKDSSAREYWSHLNFEVTNDVVKIDDEPVNYLEQAVKNEVRVNRLVKQLNANIYWYAIFLVIVYLAFLLGNKLLYVEGDPFYLRVSPLFTIIEDVCNYLSAAFLYLAFKVLYDRTLDEENEQLPYYNGIFIFSISFLFAYFIFAVPYIFSNAALIHNGKDVLDPLTNIILDPNELARREFIPNIFRLFVGVFNGVTMALLFGRYISMEHTMKKINKMKYDDLITLCTIYILPVYALAQPLFGSFHISAFGDSEVFANCVFFVCFIGKAFFLYFTFLFIKEKLMHMYLHLVITSHGVPVAFGTCFSIMPRNSGRGGGKVLPETRKNSKGIKEMETGSTENP